MYTPYYCEVLSRILNSSQEKRSKMLSNIKEIEDTIQELVGKGILFRAIDYVYDLDMSGESRKKYDQPHLILSFNKDPIEALNAIGECSSRLVNSFFVPHTF